MTATTPDYHNAASQALDIIPEAWTARELGPWPPKYFDALLGPLAAWADQRDVQFNHTGQTYPDGRSFRAALGKTEGRLVVRDAVTDGTTWHRRYVRVPDENGGPDTYREYCLAGDDGNGFEEIHFDFVTPNAEGLLSYVYQALRRSPDVANAELYLGREAVIDGNEAAGRVAVRALAAPNLQVGITARPTWIDMTAPAGIPA